MYLALADKYGNIVGNTNSAKVTIRVDVSYNSDNASSLTYSPILEGTTQFESTAGAFLVSGINFAASPGYSYKVLVETDSIDTTKPSN